MRIARSFSFRMVATAVAAFILSISIAMILIFMQYRRHMQSVDDASTLRAFSDVETSICQLLSRANEAALQMQKSKTVESYLFDIHSGEVDKVVARRNMMAELSEKLSVNSELYGVLFFKEDASLVGAMQPWRFSSDTKQHPFFSEAKLDTLPVGQDVIWLGAYPLSAFTLRNNYQAANGNTLVIGANRMCYKYDAQGPNTIILLTVISASSLERLYAHLDSDGSSIYLLDENGRQISGPDKALQGQAPQFFVSLPGQMDYGSFEYKSQEMDERVIYKRLAGLNWILVKTIPTRDYYAPVYELLRMTVFIGIVAAAVVSAAYIFWLTHFLHPFKAILQDMERVRKGDIRVVMRTPFSISEFEQLRLGENSMIEQFSQMLKHTQEIERSRVDLTLRNLQMQINPHMVFNTIAAIRWMATFSGANAVADMLMELAELIRPIYSEWRLTWTVREELNYVKHYMRLIELRYGTGFQTHIEVDEALMEVKIPLFTLQPLMENSCEHGAQNRRSLTIWISGVRDGNKGCLIVRDNGCGITPEVLSMLRESMKTGSADTHSLRHTNIGIVNIDKRIKTFSGEDCGLSIESEAGKGTVIRVWFSMDL